MSAKKRKARKGAKSGARYAERLMQDQYIHEQLGDAASRLRQAYGRVASRGGRAAEDKKLYAHLREAATSTRRAVNALRRKPEPRRRGRKLLGLALAGGGAAVILTKGREKLRPPATS